MAGCAQWICLVRFSSPLSLLDPPYYSPPMRSHPRSRALATLVAAAASAAMFFTFGAPAYGHAIIELNGKDAVAGKTSLMTLEVQHGCIDGAQGTLQVEAFVGMPWRKVVPKPVAGWTSSVEKQPKGGYAITWVKQGSPAPFGTPVYFPMSISWPTKPGTYGMSVLQICPSASNYWNEPFGPATANKPSPPLTPLAQVSVKVA
jgi:uncharacterized protein YcnI